jgi:DNA-3-methyladenine glycosylase II
VIFDSKSHIRTAGFVKHATGELARADPTMAALIEQVGPCQLSMTWRSHYFRALVETIIYQQLSGKAAGAILARFRTLYPSRRFPRPDEILRTPEETLRSAGLSRQKISCLRDLSTRVLDSSVPLRRISRLADEQIIFHLTQVKGIGRWTAEMFLIFCLGRPDVLPLDDLGIRKAIQRVYGFQTPLAASALERVGVNWKPYRSIASWYLWASVDGGAF